MKKICILLALLLCLAVPALAEEGMNVEVIKMDGVSVIVFTPAETGRKARGIAVEREPAGFALPEALTLIEKEAFVGIAAEKVEVSENVAAIEALAFAKCPNLKQIIIPASVKKIDDSALEGCENVTVYGVKGSEAERFAKENGFAFAEIRDETPADQPVTREAQPVQLPFVSR